MRVNALLVRYDGGYREVATTGLLGTDGDPLTTPGGDLLLSTSQGAGRIEGFVNYPEDSSAEADRKATSTIALLESPRWQTTVGIEPTGTGDVPLTDWDVADTITVPDQDGSPQVLPVTGLLLTEDEAGHAIYRPRVGDRIHSVDERRALTNRNFSSGDLGGRDPQAMPRGAAMTPSAGRGVASLGTGDFPWVFVAASNASDKAKAAADFVCDGTADQEQINAAITLAASGPLGGAAVVLSEGEFNLTGDLNETPALIGQVGANTTGAGTVINVTAATSGPVVSAYHLANIDFWVTAAVGTVVQMVSTGPLREVGIGRFGGSIAVGVDLIDNCVVSGLNVDRAAIGVQATTGETSLLSNVFLTGCNVGVSVDTGAMVASSLSVEVIPLNGKGVVVDGGAVFTIASGHFSTIQAGTTGIDVVSGTLNTGAATDCVFNGTATDISGATPGVPVYESDADGTRIPIRDENGVIKGYIGWESNTTNGIGVWVGDADGLNDGDSPTFLVKQDGTAYMQNGDGDGYIYISPNSGSGLYMETSAGGYVNVGHNGGVYLEAVGANLYLDTNGLRAFSGTGIDGTDTPTTAAELADVLVNLGLIASHTIT